MAKFLVVIPVKGLRNYLDSSIASVVASAQRAKVYLHVRLDTRSFEEINRVKEWKTLLTGSHNISFDYSINSDVNLPNSINLGFLEAAKEIDPGDKVMCCWLGADDALSVGAIDHVDALVTEDEDINFCGGLRNVLNENGTVFLDEFSHRYSQRDLASGKADFVSMQVVQAEGVFFDWGLFKEVGMLSERSLYAFDFDLWQRLATRAPYFNINVPLGAFRTRQGQLSQTKLSEYHEEIRRSKNQNQLKVQDLERLASEVPVVFSLYGGELSTKHIRSHPFAKRLRVSDPTSRILRKLVSFVPISFARISGRILKKIGLYGFVTRYLR